MWRGGFVATRVVETKNVIDNPDYAPDGFYSKGRAVFARL
jgi:hypothetical protein